MRRFTQLDVFTETLTGGNALAVVHDADGLSDEQMAAFARWTNLSETTFLLPPTDAAADYRVRIWTTSGELPFAGHPTLGSAAAWLDAGGQPQSADQLVQECAAGLVRVQRGERLAFAAPPLIRSGPVGEDDLSRCVAALQLDPGVVVDAGWVDNGPGWVGLLLADADAVLAAEPDPVLARGLGVGVVGPYAADRAAEVGADVEVRAFWSDGGATFEDPVTGSLNAGLAQWLIGNGALPTAYVASQGTRLGRRGRVHVEADGDDIWVGGAVARGIVGTVDL